MWFALTAAIVLTILFFSLGSNRKQSCYRKEGKNNSTDPGSDGESSSDSDSGGSFGGSGSGSSW